MTARPDQLSTRRHNSEYSGWYKRQTAQRGCSPQAVRWTTPSRTAIGSRTPGPLRNLGALAPRPDCRSRLARNCPLLRIRRLAARPHRLRPGARSVHPLCRSQAHDADNDRARSKPNFICRWSAPRSKVTGTIRAQRRRTCYVALRSPQ
jgi:hypothetical protein